MTNLTDLKINLEPTRAPAKPSRPPLNYEQACAVEAMERFLESKDKFFVLKGYAGTGKTFCIQYLIDRIKGRLVFTAPTNKATKVLRDTVTTDAYKPQCKTIYSLLGLRLEANGEIKELSAPEDPLDLSDFRAVVVDEGSMVNAVLMSHIDQAAEEFKVKFIFMGDAAQLPPVGELRSPIWGLGSGAELQTVMRHDNQILELATRIRQVVDHPVPTVKLQSNFADDEGVWSVMSAEFERRIIDAADQGKFSIPNGAKAIAWRNVTVDKLNRVIRSRLFDDVSRPWLPDDRIIVLEPAKDLDGETIATTDDEGRVTRVEESWHPVYGEFKTWRLSITTDDNRVIVLHVLHEAHANMHAQRAEEYAAKARTNRKLWGQFWEFKEAFHKVRHAYAITAHRAQGSTYDTAFVDWRDILLNRNRQEAYRCLYVACTRPKKRLILG